MHNTTPIAGIFTPNMVPLDRDGDILEGELRRYVDWLIEKGVHGLYPNGSTGEFLRFTPEERRRIVAIVCDQAAGRAPVLAGAAEANVRETVRTCEAYAELGARAVAVVAPFYYRLGQPAIEAYFTEIAANVSIDVTLYNIPMLANPITVETVRRLAEHPRIVGIKDSSGNIADMLRMMAAIEPVRPDFAFLTGWDPALLPMLEVGCHGATLATSGVAPESLRRLFDLVADGQLAQARALQFRITELFDVLFAGGDFPEGFRTGVEARGFSMGRSRQSPGAAGTIDRARLDELLAELP